MDIPLAIPTVVTGFALLLMYGPLGPVGRFLGERNIQVMFSFPGLLLGHVFVTFPFMVRAVAAVLESVPRTGEDAARTLGAQEWQVFAFVTVPAIKEGLIAGAFLTFSRSLGEFGASIMVSGNLVGRTQTGPLYIFSRFNTGDVEGAAAIAIVLALASFLILLAPPDIPAFRGEEGRMSQPHLLIENVGKSFGSKEVLNGVSLCRGEGGAAGDPGPQRMRQIHAAADGGGASSP